MIQGDYGYLKNCLNFDQPNLKNSKKKIDDVLLKFLSSCIIWDVESGQPVDTLLGHGAAVYGVSFQPQGSLVATCAFDLKTIVWDTRSSKKNGSIVSVLQGHLDDIIGIDFDSSGTLLATGSDDQTCSRCCT